MDFEQYVAARRTSLVRAAVLLGHPTGTATRAVDEVLVARGRAIDRSDHPDPDVYVALLRALGSTPEQVSPPDEGPPDEAADAAEVVEGREVRAALGALPPPARGAAVLVLHADLTPREAASALGRTTAEVDAALAESLPGLGAATEIDARERLLLAAGTVSVGPPGPLAPAEPDRRIPLLVAAGVALVVVVATVALAGSDDDPDPDPPRTDRVPSLFARDVTTAEQLLEAQGLATTVERVPACEPPDRVVGSEPPTGARVQVGGRVTIVASGLESTCGQQVFARAAAWDFVDFATGRGPAPPFAPRVNVVVDESEPAVLTAGEAAIRTSWGRRSVLAAVSAATEQVANGEDGRYLTPLLSVAEGRPPAQSCGVPRPAAAGRRAALRVTIGIPAAPVVCPLLLDLYRTDGAIDAVVLYTAKSPGG